MSCVSAWVWFCLSTEFVSKTGVGTTGLFMCSYEPHTGVTSWRLSSWPLPPENTKRTRYEGLTYIYTYMYIYIYVCMYVYMYVCIYTYTYIYIHIYIYTYISG